MSQPSWWNNDCRKAKANKYALLNIFRQTHTEQDRQNYLESKSMFKMLCREKKRLEKVKLEQKLILNVDDPRLFWRTLKESRTVAPVQNNISAFDWYSHFKTVLNQDIKIDPIFEETGRYFNTEHDIICDPCRLNEGNQDPLNAVISREDIVKKIESNKNCKAPGEDGIVIEMMNAAKIEIVLHLQSLFNKILESGNYPDDWCKAILSPLHKSVTTCNVDNYRGISLLHVVSKIFTKILNERFISWAKENNVDKEEQAGYRRNYSTIDQIFNLQSLVHTYMFKSKSR